MKLHRPIIYIHEEQVVKEQILDKIVLIKMLLIGNDQILDLEGCQLADHGHIFSARHDDDILDLVVIVDFEVHTASDFL